MLGFTAFAGSPFASTGSGAIYITKAKFLAEAIFMGLDGVKNNK